VQTQGPTVISVPARELANVAVPGSVFEIGILRGSTISPELRVAIELIAAIDSNHSVSSSVRCIARPEIFTHGASLDWLMTQIEGVTDHIALSDGTALKLIPGLRNHLFTYGLQSHRRFIDFKKLTRRAPELLGQFHSQINSFHRVSIDGLAFEPAPWLLNRHEFSVSEPVWFHDLYLNPHSLENSAELMLGWGTLDTPSFEAFSKIRYVPLTDCAARDEQFQHIVAELIATTYFEPGVCLLMRLPLATSDLTERMRLALGGIRGAHRSIPQTRANNVFFTSGDLGDDVLSELAPRLSLLLHHSFDHWRHPKSVYEASEEIAVFLDRQWTRVSDAAKKLLTEAFGQSPQFILSARSLDVDGFPE